MILRSLTLENFGLYAGRVHIDLLPRARARKPRPLVVFGGKNGAGKTSLLEAVRLALYGRLALGTRVSLDDYHAYLRGKVHRPKRSSPTIGDASVAIEFDFAEAGSVHRYTVSRSWTARGQSVTESLEVLKDGSTIGAIPREEWNLFLHELLPPGVSQLFFFDGEKIKDLAEGTADGDQLAHAIRALLGIDIVGRLRTDLGLYIARHQSDARTSAGAKLEEIVREIARIERAISEANDAIADLLTSHESHGRVAEAAKRHFVAQGGEVAVNRGRIEATRDACEKELAMLQTKLRDLSGGLLPFLAAPTLIARVISVLRSLQSTERVAGEAAILIRERFAEWCSNATHTIGMRWTQAHRQDLEAFLAEVQHSGKPTPAAAHLLGIPNALLRLEEARDRVAPLAAETARQFEECSARKRHALTQLSRLDQTTTDFLLGELQRAEQAFGASDSQLAAKQQELQELTYRLKVANRERTRILDEQAQESKELQSLELAGRVASALSAYEERLITQKAAQLEGAFIQCFNRLARKADLVRGVHIDPKTFAVTLVDADGHATPKEALSAGEKQIYAIAMLWALARTSGRNLPMIIDTPLGRLDSDHRAAIIERYLPDASHQVIVLSTDTEIDFDMMLSLDEHVSHSYVLEYMEKERRTEVAPGYFGNSVGSGADRALQQA